MSGTPGTVTCSTSSCDPDTEPERQQCPQTEDCGAWQMFCCVFGGAAILRYTSILYYFRCVYIFILKQSHTHPLLGDWVQGEPTGCADRCGVGAGLSGTPGAVNCSTPSCDPDTEPEAKECPQTEDCGKKNHPDNV